MGSTDWPAEELYENFDDSLAGNDTQLLLKAVTQVMPVRQKIVSRELEHARHQLGSMQGYLDQSNPHFGMLESAVISPKRNEVITTGNRALRVPNNVRAGQAASR